MPTIINGTTGVSLVQDGTITPAKTTGQRVLAQIVTFQTGAVATGTTIIPLDDTIPQNTEGDQYMSLAITPVNALSTLEIDVLCHISGGTAGNLKLIAALFKDSDANALSADVIGFDAGSANQAAPIAFKFIMSSGSTSPITFKVRGGSNVATTTTFNGSASARIFGGVMASRITIKEYLP